MPIKIANKQLQRLGERDEDGGLIVDEGSTDTCSVGKGGISNIPDYLAHDEIIGVRCGWSEEHLEELRSELALTHGEGKGDIA